MAALEPTKYSNKLAKARVLIIGGTSGIGFGVAEALIEHGSSVIISSSSPERVSKAVNRLQSAYPSAQSRVSGYPCDLGSEDTLELQVASLFAEIAKGGKLDHVVHTAGDALKIGKIEDFSLKDMKQSGMVRFFSPLVVAKHLREHLKGGPASSYIMTTGGASIRPHKDWSVVMPYLTGLEGMCTALATDMAPIRVNAVGLGPVMTELWNPFRKAGSFDAVKQMYEGMMATKTIARVEDVVESYLYLMKDRNVTGIMVNSNGGMTLDTGDK